MFDFGGCILVFQGSGAGGKLKNGVLEVRNQWGWTFVEVGKVVRSRGDLFKEFIGFRWLFVLDYWMVSFFGGCFLGREKQGFCRFGDFMYSDRGVFCILKVEGFVQFLQYRCFLGQRLEDFFLGVFVQYLGRNEMDFCCFLVESQLVFLQEVLGDKFIQFLEFLGCLQIFFLNLSRYWGF